MPVDLSHTQQGGSAWSIAPRRRLLPRDSGFLLYLLPALAVLLVFRYAPIGLAVWVSFWRYSLLGGYGSFAGLEQYQQALKDPTFWNALWVTAGYTVLKVPLQIAVGLGMALLLQGESQVKQALRTVVFIPAVMSVVVASVVWSMMYHSQFGLINGALLSMRLPLQPFLLSAAQAMPSIVVMSIWKDVGLTMLILVAALGAIPTVYYEAARIDGASRVQVFRHITLPMLHGALLFVLITETIQAIQIFVPMYSMTQGGPNEATKTLVYYIYQLGFQLQDMGYASALSIILVLLLVLVSLVQARVAGRRGA